MNKSHARGFTLLELLVAIGIFAVLSVLAYGGLRSVLDARAQTDRQALRLGDLQKTLTLLERDIQQLSGRAIRDAYGDYQPALRAGAQSETSVLEFTRNGWSNPAGARRSHLQRVAYGLREERLLRLSWLVLDRAPDSAALEAVLLDGVRDIALRFKDEQGEWHEQWPPIDNVGNAALASPPRGIEFTIELTDLGRIVRLFPLPAARTPQAANPLT